MTLKNIKHTLLLVAMVAVAWSCGGGGSSSAPKPSTTPPPTTGVATHAGATWTKSSLGPVAAMDFDNGVAGDDGTLLGSRSVNKCRLTFKTTVNTTGFREIQWLLFLKAESGGAETNFQLMVVSANETRFIMQRFGDFSNCSPRGLNGGRWGCEEQDHHGDIVFNDPSRVYAFDCNWDGSASKQAACVVTSSDNKMSTTYQVGMGGAYNSLLRLAVGTFSIDGYPDVPSTVTDFRFSVL